MIQTRPDFNSDFAIAQNWKNYDEEEHAIWRLLFERSSGCWSGARAANFSPDWAGSGSLPTGSRISVD